MLTRNVTRNRDTLDDISLEPRDCLTLWRCMKKHKTKEFPLETKLDPSACLPEVLKKSHALEWEAALKSTLHSWMRNPSSPYSAVLHELRSTVLKPRPAADDATTTASTNDEWVIKSADSTALALLVDLFDRGALPAILFNYDRSGCETVLKQVLEQLERAENQWKRTSPEWAKTMASFRGWKLQSKLQAKKTTSLRIEKGQDKDDRVSKADVAREEGNREHSRWESFNPDAPVGMFSFADQTKLDTATLEKAISRLNRIKLDPYFVKGLRRGLAVHHAGMNRLYRQT